VALASTLGGNTNIEEKEYDEIE